VGGLELLDQPPAGLALEAAVQAAGQDRRPLLDRDARLEVDLGAVAGVRGPALAQDAGVELKPETEAAPAVPPIEADAAEALVLRELANGDLERLRGLVEAQVAIIICE
jgi:hypothetical protein